MTTETPAEATAPATSRARLVGPDVTRAVALVGVVVMNYHGYLNGSDAAAQRGDPFFTRLFDPWHGVLSTRFAATFVLVAGVGVSLLTERSRRSGDRTAIGVDRWKLVRRGVLLYAFGFVLDWIWPGTILVYYGAFFVAAAALFTLRTRWLVVVGTVAALTAAGVQWWAAVRQADGHSVDWLLAPDTLGARSPRGLLFDTFLDGTHPLLPWLAFLCAGMVLGRSVRTLPHLRLAAIGLSITLFTYLVNHVGTSGHAADRVRVQVLATSPFERGLLYTLGTLGTAVAAFCIISWLAERTADTGATQLLQRAGQMTLSIYVAHVLVFNLMVDWLGAVGGGLGSALLFALAFWTLAVPTASMWRRFAGQGPLERVYRRFGG
jgi:uncharacterized membrane protein YeiB